jgi:hypothetical protein
MLSEYASQWKNRVKSLAPSRLRLAPRRDAFGSTGWGPAPELETRQPQDGGSEMDDRSQIAQMASQRINFIEPEDARLTGGTRSLMRRLMGLNVASTIKTPMPARAATLPERAQVA